MKKKFIPLFMCVCLGVGGWLQVSNAAFTLVNINSVTQTGTWTGSSVGESTLVTDDATGNRGALFGRDGLDLTANFSSAGSLASGVTITYDLGLRRTATPARTMMMKGVDTGGNVLFVLGLQGDDGSSSDGHERLVVFSEDFTGSPTGGGGGTITYLGTIGTFAKGTNVYDEDIMHTVSLVLSASSFDVLVDGALVENGNDIPYLSGAGTDIQALNFQTDIAGGAWYDNFEVTTVAPKEVLPASLGMVEVVGGTNAVVGASGFGDGSVNSLQMCDDLTSNNWVTVATTTGVESAEWVYSVTNSAAFFRVISE
ncbi:hypothetical protein P4E94_16745 [Pontiellaceae bacterium B12219]|nr:hypothetical protein [Pontiellaceae bacterium B12219]